MQTLDPGAGPPPQLGFGCASVMGRVGRRASLAAIHAAWDAGITLFDTARSYGYGEAESLLGDFLNGRRAQATIITKFGIVPRPQPAWRRAAKPLVRAALQHLPALRASVRRTLANDLPPSQFDTHTLQTSIHQSLRALRTDYVDILLAHEAPASLVAHDDLIASMQSLVQAGKARQIGIACTQQIAAQLIANNPPTLNVLQFPANLYTPAEPTLALTTTHLKIANHTLGGAIRAQAAQARLAALINNPALDITLREKLQGDPDTRLAEIVFASVRHDVQPHSIIASMLQPNHLRANLEAITSTRFSANEVAQLHGHLTD